MKQRIINRICSISILVLLAVATFSPWRVSAVGITYEVDWPAIHLDGDFTLDVGAGFGIYTSTAAQGTYGGLNGNFNTVWTSVQFNSQPTFSELTFFWNQGSTGYAVTPSYVGRPTPWTSASEAWQDLITKGTADAVFISAVPEPSTIALFCTALPLLMLFRRRGRREL